MRTRLGCGVALSVVARARCRGVGRLRRRPIRRHDDHDDHDGRSGDHGRRHLRGPADGRQGRWCRPAARTVQLTPTIPAPATTTDDHDDPTARPTSCPPTRVRDAGWCTPSRGSGRGSSRPTARCRRTYLVSGRLTWNQPSPGTYHVFSRSSFTCNIKNPTICWRMMVRFTVGPDGDNIGFHEIPKVNGKPIQSEAQLGQALSGGCVRQATPDAEYMWAWAPVGTDGRRPRLTGPRKPQETVKVGWRADAVRSPCNYRAAVSWGIDTTIATAAAVSAPYVAAAADDRAHRAHVARLLRCRGRARRRAMGRLEPQPRRARRGGAPTVRPQRPTSSSRARPARRPNPTAPDDHHGADVPAGRSRGRRTSSSPAPTTTPASIPTRRTPARSATARTSASAATRSWCGGSTRRPTSSRCCRSHATCTSGRRREQGSGSTPPTGATTRRGCRTRSS